MGDALWQPSDPARIQDLGPIGEPDLERTLDDEADLILAAVDVHPIAVTRFERRFEQVDRAAGVLAGQLVRDAKEVQHRARSRCHEGRSDLVGSHSCLHP